MKSLILRGPRDFVYEERPFPKASAQDVIVKIGAVCMCGSDVHAIRGDRTSFACPVVIGHEASGTVVQVGEDVRSLAVGDTVALMPCISCGTCRACRKGRTNSCSSLQLYGVHRDGAMQEYLCTPAKYWLKIPFDVSFEAAAMLEPLTIGAHAVAKLDLQSGDRVLVIGAGPIGMSCAVSARTRGASVTMAETNEGRRVFGREHFPFPILSPLSEDYLQELNRLTDGELFDAVIDTTAAKVSMDNAWRYLTQGGKVVFVGICNGTLEIDGRPFHMKEPALYTTRNSTRQDYEWVIQQWAAGSIDPTSFLTHTVSFDKAGKNLIEWVDNPDKVFKGVVSFN